VNLLRHLNATFDFSGHQFVARSFVPPPPPHATRVDLHYARGGGMIVRSKLGGDNGPHAAMLVDTHRPFYVALDEAGWKKAGVDPTGLKLIPGDPEQKLREGEIPLLKLGAFERKRVSGLYGVPLGDLEKATAVDLDGLIGAAMLMTYRCTFADGGRVLWIEDDTEEILHMLGPSAREPAPAPAAPAPAAPAPAAPPKGPVNQAVPPPLPKK
jgi:hypothetical protein